MRIKVTANGCRAFESEQLAFDWFWKGVLYESTLPAMPKAIHHGCIEEFKENFFVCVQIIFI